MRKTVITSIVVSLFQALFYCATQVAVAQTTRAPVIKPANPDVFQAVSQFYEYNRKSLLQAETLGKQDFPKYTREKIVFTGVQYIRVPGYLAIPKNRTGPCPVVILIDGIFGSKARWFEEDSWPRGTLVTNALIESGIAVMALDARYHGERGAENDYRIPEDWSEQRDMIVQSVIEHRRAMDYLATKPEIDATRIGLLGLSMGGIMTFALTSMDPRVRAAVAGLTPVGALKEPTSIPIAPQTFAGAITETPILMLMGRTDKYYTVEEAEQLFNSIKSHRKELVFYEAGHRLPAEYASRAADWFRKYLKQ